MDGPDCESSRKYEGWDAVLEKVARVVYIGGSGHLFEATLPDGQIAQQGTLYVSTRTLYVSMEVRHEREKTIRF
jgi:hypothetical protein